MRHAPQPYPKSPEHKPREGSPGHPPPTKAPEPEGSVMPARPAVGAEATVV
jgi:hypothetical protein